MFAKVCCIYLILEACPLGVATVPTCMGCGFAPLKCLQFQFIAVEWRVPCVPKLVGVDGDLDVDVDVGVGVFVLGKRN